MQYLLMIYGDEKAMAAVTEAQGGKMLAAYGAYAEAMGKAGVLQGGNRLRPTSASTTVRVTDGRTTVLDGPYVETKEQLGGYFLIDVPDLDAALSWAARCPGASTPDNGLALKRGTAAGRVQCCANHSGGHRPHGPLYLNPGTRSLVAGQHAQSHPPPVPL